MPYFSTQNNEDLFLDLKISDYIKPSHIIRTNIKTTIVNKNWNDIDLKISLLIMESYYHTYC